jgi:DNA-binding response OmpR family regulator
MKKILVIEGGAKMRRNLTTILRPEKFHTLSAENGRVGVELAKTEKPDGGVLASPQLRPCLAWEGASQP